ncbi:recombinase family protein [Paenibacillus sp. N3.4]|nr:recombinase family protein [Paenibacillus sp. N3.4]
MVRMLAVIAEPERDIISERTIAELSAARTRVREVESNFIMKG